MPKDKILADATERMKHAIDHAQHELSAIRTGKATPALLDTVRVPAYGGQSAIQQVRSCALPSRGSWSCSRGTRRCSIRS
jgi:ribosome recycling factor